MTRSASLLPRRRLVAALLAILLAPVLRVPAWAEAASLDTDRIVLDWYDQTAVSVVAAGFPTQITNSRIWALSWLAASRAIGRSSDPARASAALATSVHDVLVSLVPGRAADLDSALGDTLEAIPDGKAKRRGELDGAREAERVLAEREGDGLDVASVNAPWTPPPGGPGVWQPTPPAFGPAVQAGQPRGHPFLLGTNDRFRPGPPPALESQEYLEDLAEVRTTGVAEGSSRTQEQTDVALFWAQSSLAALAAYAGLLRAVLEQSTRPIAWQVRLVATFHVVTIDAQLAIYEAKYTYVRWRPVTAIRIGEVDPDPSWTPLWPTPSHPEYPSGHSGYAGAAQVVLEAFVGPGPQEPIALTSTTAPGVTRTYGSWSTLTRENVDGRVWEGVHFRYADETGAEVGRQVARYDLARLPTIGL